MTGRLIGVGTGPGDPELMTLKAVRALASAKVVAHFAKKGNTSNARMTVASYLQPDTIELPLIYPVTTEIPRADAAYIDSIASLFDDAARTIAAHLDAGRSVAVLSEGDPLFYGSYMHLHVRLSPHYPTEVIPGVTAMSGCWSALGQPIAQGDDVLVVLPGTLDEAELAARLRGGDAAIIMKVGRNLPKIRRTLAALGRLDQAYYVERGTMPSMVTMRLCDKKDDMAPYFSIVLLPGWRGRP